MEHQRAAETHAVERYILGEMLPDERDSFEEHYFSCPECADEVRSAARFRTNAREVLRRLPPPERRFCWWSWPSAVPVAASVLLFGVVVYQAGFQIPSLKHKLEPGAAEAAIPFTLRGTSRSAEDAVRIPAGIRRFSLNFDLPETGRSSSYRCSILNAEGKVVAEPVIEVPHTADSLSLFLARDRFAPGTYRIDVRGSTSIVTQLTFLVE